MNKLVQLLQRNKISFQLFEGEKLDPNILVPLIQNITKNSFCYYSLGDNSNAETNFIKRIEGLSHGTVVVFTKNKNVDALKAFFRNKTMIFVENHEEDKTKKLISDEIFPIKKMPILMGVTGTNGKTSTISFVSQLLSDANVSAISIGTLGTIHNLKGVVEETGLTTPDHWYIKSVISRFSDVEVIAMECSSHSLAQKRLGDLSFDVIGWTNFSQDHLDFHGDLRSYFEAKCLLLERHLKTDGFCFIPCTEKKLREDLHEKYRDRILFSEVVNSSQIGFQETNFSLAKNMLEGARFNVSDSEDNSYLVPGRFEKIEAGERIFIVDYAHTPEALVTLLKQVRKTFSDKKVITVFGCGGDRDRVKRPLMYLAAKNHSDEIIITNDNPRSEDPEEIVKDMNPDPGVEVILDRKEAIRASFDKFDSGWVVVIAGKGHENYQEINGVKNFFSDRECVENLSAK